MIVKSKNRWSIEIGKQLWGPLVLMGGVFLFLYVLSQPAPLIGHHWLGLGTGAFLIVAGIAFMLLQLGPTVPVDPAIDGQGVTALEHTVLQLAKNYEILRRQTSQAFVISASLMTVGVLSILIAALGPQFGFTEKSNALTSVAGTISSAISGIGMYLYNTNFKRLKEVTDRLEHTSRILTAHRLAESLPPEQKTQASLALINALVNGGSAGSITGNNTANAVQSIS